MFSVAYNPHNLTFKYKWCTAAVVTLVKKMHNSYNFKTEISRWLPNSLQHLKKRQLITDFHANFQQLVKPTNNWIPETKSCVYFGVVFQWTISGQNQHKTEQHSISDKSMMISQSLQHSLFLCAAVRGSHPPTVKQWLEGNWHGRFFCLWLHVATFPWNWVFKVSKSYVTI